MKMHEGPGYRDLLEWWRTQVTADVSERVRFLSHMTATRGPRAFLETPKVVVGEIHSVQGGRADVVYLFPNLSQAADAQYARAGAARESVIRRFYVGLTRARETLYTRQPRTGMAVTV